MSATVFDAAKPTMRQLVLAPGRNALIKRLGACIFGGLVLALMVGPQEGTLTDFGVAFRQAVIAPRVFVFIGIGVVVFFLITLWPLVRPYVNRPGMAPLAAGILVVVIAQTVMDWYDPLQNQTGNPKFAGVSDVVAKTSGLSALTTAFFGWAAWTLLAVMIVLCAVTIATRLRVLGFACALVGVLAALLAYTAHSAIVNKGGGIDHSLGVYADVIGFVTLSGAALVAVFARSDTADTRAFLRTVADFRPGLPFAVGAAILGVLAFTTAGWFGTLTTNLDISEASKGFDGTPLGALAADYLSYLGYLIFAVGSVLTLAACYLRNRMLGWAATAVAVVGIILTFLTLHDMTDTGAKVAPQFGPTWQNLGAGGYAACMAFTLYFGAALSVALVQRSRTAVDPETGESVLVDPQTGERIAADSDPTRKLPVGAMITKVRGSRNAKVLVVVALGFALFYPPTLPVVWQNVLVSQIGVYVLLAIGLNVVVGWAGLLDLGFIAFYEIGSYTTAYLVGKLPVQPPSWLQMTPLLTIPFAILVCLIAGVLLGAPTLRLRGDYLAIVTLGFGEIIQQVALNSTSFTGGPVGPNVPHPSINLFGLHITWGEDDLPYWYLLLVMLVIVLVLFYRLERSRIGRAWAAIREDEVAAQASGVNIVKIKLLAFAIGASTSGLAGVFFASQIGYFDPTIFTLQASILIVAYVVFGGMGSLPGAMAGAAVLTWLPQFLKAQVPAADRQMWIGALVLAMMIFRPAGLLPAKRRKAELRGFEQPSSAESTAVPVSEGL